MPLTADEIGMADKRGVYIKLPPEIREEIDRELEKERLARNAKIGEGVRRTKQANRAVREGASDRNAYDILSGKNDSYLDESSGQPVLLVPVSSIRSRNIDPIPDRSRLSSSDQRSDEERHEAHIKALDKAIERTKKSNEKAYRKVDREYEQQLRRAREEARRKSRPPIYADGDIGDFDEDFQDGRDAWGAGTGRETENQTRRAQEKERSRSARMEEAAARTAERERERAIAYQQRRELAAQRAEQEQRLLDQRAAQRALIQRERQEREKRLRRERAKRNIQRGVTNTARGVVVASKKQKYAQARTDGRRYTEAQLRKRKGLPPPERSVGDWIGLGLLGALSVVGFMYITQSGIFHREE
jgi:hypothetical protein